MNLPLKILTKQMTIKYNITRLHKMIIQWWLTLKTNIFDLGLLNNQSFDGIEKSDSQLIFALMTVAASAKLMMKIWGLGNWQVFMKLLGIFSLRNNIEIAKYLTHQDIHSDFQSTYCSVWVYFTVTICMIAL